MADLALDSPSGENSLPLAPVHLPEFGQSVSWLMFRIPMCRNFGIPFNGPLPRRRDMDAIMDDDSSMARYTGNRMQANEYTHRAWADAGRDGELSIFQRARYWTIGGKTLTEIRDEVEAAGA